MKNKQIQEFLTKVASDESFKASVLKLNQKVEGKKLSEEDGKQFISKVVLPKAKELGYDFSEKDLAEFFASQEGANLASLSPEDLENVSGGVFPVAAMVLAGLLGAFGVGALHAVAGGELNARYKQESAQSNRAGENSDKNSAEASAEDGAEDIDKLIDDAYDKISAEDSNEDSDNGAGATDEVVQDCKNSLSGLKDRAQELADSVAFYEGKVTDWQRSLANNDKEVGKYFEYAQEKKAYAKDQHAKWARYRDGYSESLTEYAHAAEERAKDYEDMDDTFPNSSVDNLGRAEDQYNSSMNKWNMVVNDRQEAVDEWTKAILDVQQAEVELDRAVYERSRGLGYYTYIIGLLTDLQEVRQEQAENLKEQIHLLHQLSNMQTGEKVAEDNLKGQLGEAQQLLNEVEKEIANCNTRLNTTQEQKDLFNNEILLTEKKAQSMREELKKDKQEYENALRASEAKLAECEAKKQEVQTELEKLQERLQRLGAPEGQD